MTDTHTTTAPTEEWRRHEPVWGPPVPGEEYSDRSIHNCTECALTRPDGDHSVATFAAHLKTLGAPDYMLTYWNDWARHVEQPNGFLDRDAVARELFDYGVVMGEASEVYSDLAGLSKPNTAAHHVIAAAEDRNNERQADLILHELLPEIEDEAARKAVIDYAEELHEGAYEQYRESQARLAKLPGSNVEETA